jgi:hypothetical protein
LHHTLAIALTCNHFGVPSECSSIIPGVDGKRVDPGDAMVRARCNVQSVQDAAAALGGTEER